MLSDLPGVEEEAPMMMMMMKMMIMMLIMMMMMMRIMRIMIIIIMIMLRMMMMMMMMIIMMMIMIMIMIVMIMMMIMIMIIMMMMIMMIMMMRMIMMMMMMMMIMTFMMMMISDLPYIEEKGPKGQEEGEGSDGPHQHHQAILEGDVRVLGRYLYSKDNCFRIKCCLFVCLTSISPISFIRPEPSIRFVDMVCWTVG